MAHKREEDIIRKRRERASNGMAEGRMRSSFFTAEAEGTGIAMIYSRVGLANCLNPPNAGTYPLHCGSLKSGMI